MDQGSPEWYEERLGKVTGSRFADVMAWKRGRNKSGGHNTYMLELASELLTGRPHSEFSAKATDWGHKHEDDARTWYVIETGNEVQRAPFVNHPVHAGVGCSPDSFVGDDGILEIKCPFNSTVHLSTLLSGRVPEEHEAQVHGNMWVTGRQWCDFISYDPRMKDSSLAFFMVRVERDDQYMAEIEEAVVRFRDQLNILLGKHFGIKGHQ